ncbi:MAG: YcaQ family DNA glycosylase [Streptosporangiaceae bacterium]|nr:YcaQ family DNA glycosylase [Streptosporangiaceae bacterium]
MGLTLGLDEVRRITLRSQGFLGAASRRGGIAGMLNRIGAVQLDTISVLARSHELVAYARLGPIGRDRIERAYWHPRKPATFEYWAHAACILPIEEWPFYAFRRRTFRARGLRWHQVSETACKQVLARLAADGPLTATELGGAKGGGPWWDWSEVKIAAEWLLDIGEVVCVRRTGWRRVYDLPERALPADLLNGELTDQECLSRLLTVTARALGVVTRPDFVDYHRLSTFLNGQPQPSAVILDAAAEAAGLTPVTIATEPKALPGGRAGKASQVTAWADPAALAAEAAAGPERNRVTLLSPFDSLIWDRKRTLRMFGFEHSLEAYVPKEKRVHGYFTMPLLAGGRLVGRVDPARDGTTLVARKVSLERASAAAPMAQALREAASWVGCDDVRIEHLEPAEHASALAAALARC